MVKLFLCFATNVGTYFHNWKYQIKGNKNMTWKHEMILENC